MNWNSLPRPMMTSLTLPPPTRSASSSKIACGSKSPQIGGWGTIVVNDKAEFAISSVSWLDPAFCGWNHAGCVVEMMHAAVPRGMMLKKKIRRHG
eukprot:scaffold45470_cov39-Cyclotella_meneghiniana.AAC.1